MKIIAAAVTLALVSGCSIFPETREALLEKGNHNPDYCTADDVAVVTSRVEGYFSKCIRSNQVNVGNGASFVSTMLVEKNTTDAGTDFSVYSPSGTAAGYYLTTRISSGPASCRTRVSATSYNFMWSRHFDKLIESAKGNDPSCLL
ncbi:hypothetical protein GV819_19940 [Pseudomonas sp. Fl5BN2]|uniref:hypothetical protein n=1 Tax=unclassified Pseudomonas TaxID=196821 RepID=UPI00137802AA|nr:MULTISPECIES: hypothetical protein [unclassified Pseudomonas]NBF04556.1 hypothetical protein [Pseudomonas sp. Fl5BN2]NBF11527.1 hypothetical protein [Pseudomonas sp. Fl4BN1]